MLRGSLGQRASLVIGRARQMAALAFMVVVCSPRFRKKGADCCILPPGGRDVAASGKGGELSSRSPGRTAGKAKACDLHAQERKEKQ